jgi:hypothetical protein
VNQEPRVTDTRLAVMNVELGIPCSAALAPVSVSSEHDFPVAAEVILGVPAHPITRRAEAGDGRYPFAAGAKQRLLPRARLYTGPQDAFVRLGEG